jgi:hypothetical protein
MLDNAANCKKNCKKTFLKSAQNGSLLYAEGLQQQGCQMVCFQTKNFG